MTWNATAGIRATAAADRFGRFAHSPGHAHHGCVRRGRYGRRIRLSLYFGLCAVAYMLLMIPYSIWLKEVFLIDTMSIAMGFIIRAVAGVIVLRTPTSPVPLTSWFVICVMFIALFIAFSKRRSERVLLDTHADEFRPVLAMYSVALMDKVIVVCAYRRHYVLYALRHDRPAFLGHDDHPAVCPIRHF